MANDIVTQMGGGLPQINHGPGSSSTDIAMSRQIQEVQAMVVMAKRFPRDEYEAAERIKRACQRRSLAEQAIYTYPRGGQQVMGPSIRLAEAIAKAWGNLQCGVVELSKDNGKSEMEAFCWDLESNVRVSKTFTVDHTRDTRQGKKKLTDDRDIYEATANFGARRMRACILSVIPGDVVDMAVFECKKTMVEGNGEPMQVRLEKVKNHFKSIGVTQEMLEEYCGRPFGTFGNEEIFALQGVVKAIKDGQSSVETFFPGMRKEAPKKMTQEELAAMQQANAGQTIDPNAMIAQQQQEPPQPQQKQQNGNSRTAAIPTAGGVRHERGEGDL